MQVAMAGFAPGSELLRGRPPVAQPDRIRGRVSRSALKHHPKVLRRPGPYIGAKMGSPKAPRVLQVRSAGLEQQLQSELNVAPLVGRLARIAVDTALLGLNECCAIFEV